MNEFTLPINEANFRRTNAAWNDLCLNDPWSVGYVSTLIEVRTFSDKEEWEQFYYRTGQERELQVLQLDRHKQKLLNDHTLRHTNPQQIDVLEWSLKNLNYQYGRTKEQLNEKGKILYGYVIQRHINITLEECAECVRYRTICETWNGIIIRERNTVRKLKEIFPNVEFIKTNGDFDHKYAVDYELRANDKLLCGVQIKPKTYTFNTPYIIKARNANSRKNQEYFGTYQRPVFDVISKTSGEIENPEVINKIRFATT